MARRRGRASAGEWVWITPGALMQACWEQRIGDADPDSGWVLRWPAAGRAPRTAADEPLAALDSRHLAWAWNRLGTAWDPDGGDPGFGADDLAYAQNERQAQWVAALRALGSRVANAAGAGDGLGLQVHPLRWLAAAAACGLRCADFAIETRHGRGAAHGLDRIGAVAAEPQPDDAPGWFQRRAAPARRAWVFGARYGGPGDAEFACRCTAFVASLGWACAGLDLQPGADGALQLVGVDPCPAVGDDAAGLALCEDWMQDEAASGHTDVEDRRAAR